MPRKVQIVTVGCEGRDKGKVFILTEMPALQAEKWAMRVFFALGKGGVDLPDEVKESGMAGIAILLSKDASPDLRRAGIFKSLSFATRCMVGANFDDAEPLLDEMFNCVRYRPDPNIPQVTRELVNYGTDGDDIEEVATRFYLRQEVLNLHVNFSSPGDSQKPKSTSATSPGASAPSPIPMSPAQSAR